MKKTFLAIFLTFALVLTTLCAPVLAAGGGGHMGGGGSVPDNTITQDEIDEIKREAGDVPGSSVKVPTDMTVALDGNAYGEYYQNTNYAEDTATFDFKAEIDMEPVQNKFLAYMSYADEFAEAGMSQNDLNAVVVEGYFEVYIKFTAELYALIPDAAKTAMTNPGADMEGFALDSGSTGVLATDVYTEFDEEGNREPRTLTEDAHGDWVLSLKIYPKSPTGTGKLTAGDLQTGVGDPYAEHDYTVYLADLSFTIDDIALPIAQGEVIYESVYGYFEGETDFAFYDALSQTRIELHSVSYSSVQEEGGEDPIQIWEAGYDSFMDDAGNVVADKIRVPKISTSVDLRRPQDGATDLIKITFVVNGDYFDDPAGIIVTKAGVDYTNWIPTIYSPSPYEFNPDDFDEIPGKHNKWNFKGWSLTRDGAVITDTTSFTEDTILYAVFSKKSDGGGGGTISKITLTFNVSGDTTVVPAISGYAPIKCVLEDLVVPEKDGFAFDGWYADGSYTQKVESPYTTNVSATLFGRYVSSEVPSDLEDGIHFAYVIGYPEGDVRPENNISREEIATIFYRLLKKDVRDSIFTDENSFTDVEQERWSNKAVSTMANGKYVLGYEDGTFRPEAPITRAEFVTIAARFLEKKNNNTVTFSDIEGHWAESYIELAAGQSWIAGYEDGTFRPDSYITRAEAMAIINRILVRYVNKAGLHANTKQWPDNLESAWYYYDVLEATNAHDYDRQADGIHETWSSINENNVWAEKPEYEDAE